MLPRGCAVERRVPSSGPPHRRQYRQAYDDQQQRRPYKTTQQTQKSENHRHRPKGLVPPQEISSNGRQRGSDDRNRYESRPQIFPLLLPTQMREFASAGLVLMPAHAEIGLPPYGHRPTTVRRSSPECSPAATTIAATNQNQNDNIEDSEHVQARSS